jgi:Ricin-type beta-trefoil lectin domain/Putative Ig domain
VKRFLVLVPWVAVGISVFALTPSGPAAAGTARGTGAHLAPVHVINLHKAYEARLRQATTQGQIAGIVYPLGSGPLRGRGGNNCAEPYCPVVYQGGSVQHTPHVYLLLWGPNWESDPNQAATASYLQSFYSGLGVQPQDNWSTVTSQYGDSSGFPTFGAGVFVGVFQDTNTPPTGVGQGGLAAEADAFATKQGITDLGDAQIVVATQSGTCPAGFVGTGCGGTNKYYCAWHGVSNEPYTNLPYLLDAGTACGENFVNTSGTHDGFSIVGSDEYADTITDPNPTTGWYDFFDQGNFGEIADKCTWDPHSHDVMLSTGQFAMQPLWSNNAHECVMLIGGGTDQVVVANPGNQSTYQNSQLHLDISGTSSGQHPLTWSATGLPTGLSIGPSGTGPGLISGQITAPPGVYQVTVQASDTTEAFGWYSFTWTVTQDVGTAVTNQASGTCLNDRGSSIDSGNPVQMWKCNVSPPEMFTHPTNAGEIIVLGQCLTDPNGPLHGGPGTLQVIEPCAPGAADQQWFHNSKNEYVLGSNFLCLTDQNGSKTPGVPVKVEKCTGATDQQWSGPS